MTLQGAHRLFLGGEYERAAEAYLSLAKEGDAEGAFDYAHCLRYGLGVPADASAVKSFYTFARELPGGDASYNLAIQHLHGEGVARDYRRAMQYMRSAAEDGCLEAKLYLGMAYTTGCVFEPDVIGISRIPYHTPIYREAENLLSTPMYTDDMEADEEQRYSVLHADAREAFEWFRSAALHDPTYVEPLVSRGQYLYAKCYLDGMGTEIDRERGVRLMLLAGKNGSREAVEFLESAGVPVTRLLGKR